MIMNVVIGFGLRYSGPPNTKKTKLNTEIKKHVEKEKIESKRTEVKR